MATNKDRFDKSRDQYISHKLYLERRAGNRYYNLGYKMYEGITSTPQTIIPNLTNLKQTMIYFNIALLFNQNDIDADTRKKDLCQKYGPTGSIQSIFNQNNINTWYNEARQEFKNCRC